MSNPKIIETEVKIRIDSETVVNLERILGKARWIKQQNLIYPTKEGFIRFRNEEGKTKLTIKGKIIPGKYKIRPENECSISFEVFSTALKAKSSSAIYFEKLRASYKFGKTIICLDKLNERYFIEIEGEEKEITSTLYRLNLESLPFEKRSYDEIVGGKND